MKKIVALVLSLVMTLSLCTVAFAAVKDGDKFTDKMTETAETKTYKYVKASDYEAGDNNYVEYLVNADTKYAVVTKDGDKLYADGKVADIQLGKEKTDAELTYLYTAKKVAKSAWSCTTDKHAAGYVLVDENDDTYYVVDAKSSDVLVNDKTDFTKAFNVLVDGKLVKVVADDTYLGGQHVLCAKDGKPTEVGVGVYEAYCAACKKTLKVSQTNINGQGFLYTDDIDVKALTDAGVKIAIPAGYKLLEGEWYVLDGAKVTDTTKDGVNSAKTFDAGIAMYVGMSLLSVAGGAVVIGKKKEF